MRHAKSSRDKIVCSTSTTCGWEEDLAGMDFLSTVEESSKDSLTRVLEFLLLFYLKVVYSFLFEQNCSR